MQPASVPKLIQEIRSEDALYARVHAIYGPERAARMMDQIVLRRLESDSKLDGIVLAMWPEVARVMGFL